MKNKPLYAIESVDNALHLAQLLLLEGPMRVTDAARHLGVSPSTAHRLLAMLVYRDFAEQGPDRLYRPGTTLRSSGTSQAPLALLRLAAGPFLQQLVEHVNESANLVVLSGTDVRFVTTVECTQVLRAGDRAGKALPVHLTSAGKAILALLDEKRVSWILSHLNEAERSRANRELAAAQHNGYGINNQRTETGLTALGVAVRAPDGQPIAGVSLSMPSIRFAKDRVDGWVRELSACRAAIERELAQHVTAL